MSIRLKFAAGLFALGLGAVIAVPSSAQRPAPRSSPPPQQRPPKPAQPRADRPPQHQQQKGAGQPGSHGNTGAGNPGNPGNTANHAGSTLPSGNNPNRPPSAYTPPLAPQKKFNERPAQEQKKLVEDYNKYQNLSPSQQREIQERYHAWNRLTPGQQQHVRNDILPKWKQMPVERRQAIRQRLMILQNMPESAKNQRLNDPNFTRGMSEDDKTTLRDLTHMHIGAPDPPGE